MFVVWLSFILYKFNNDFSEKTEKVILFKFQNPQINTSEELDTPTEQPKLTLDAGESLNGVSDVDSGHLSSGEDFEDNLSSFHPSEASASPAQLGELDDAQDWILRSEIKIEQTEVAGAF